MSCTKILLSRYTRRYRIFNHCVNILIYYNPVPTKKFFLAGIIFAQQKDILVTTTQVLKQSVAVFSKSYLPMNQINIKRAIILLVTGKAEPLDLGDGGKPIVVHSPTMVLFVPQHIRLTVNHKERAWRVPAVTRREVLRRDKHTCQYCGSTKHLTLDHVIPVSKGGKDTWDNIVTACERCNNRKGDRTPQQTGMVLRTTPKAPVHPIVAFAEQFWRDHKIQREKLDN
jgi:5-methylcytosine-specific restriction endonuclease McrA